MYHEVVEESYGVVSHSMTTSRDNQTSWHPTFARLTKNLSIKVDSFNSFLA